MSNSVVRKGTLVSNSASHDRIKIRHEPNGEVKLDKSAGIVVKVLAESLDNARRTWYKISYGNGANDIGWVLHEVITAITVEPTTGAPPTEAPTPPSDENTRLTFQTRDNKYSIRVYEQNGELLMNVHDRVSKKTLSIRKFCLPPDISTPEGSKIFWQIYGAEYNGKVFWTRFVPLYQSELIISRSLDGKKLFQEFGTGNKGTAYSHTTHL